MMNDKDVNHSATQQAGIIASEKQKQFRKVVQKAVEEKNSESIQELWDRINSYDPVVQKACRAIWDEAGRPKAHIWTGVIVLLNASTTYDQFLDWYKQLFSSFVYDDFKLESDALSCYAYYTAGIKRIGKE